MRRWGSLTLSGPTNCYHFAFLFPLQIYPCQVLANLIRPWFSQIFFHREYWGWEGHGVKLIWKTTAKSAFQNILLRKAISAAGAGKAWRSAGSLSPQSCQGTWTYGDGAWHGQWGHTQGAGLLFSLSSQPIPPGVQLISLELKRCCRPCSLMLCFCYLSNNCGSCSTCQGDF